MQQIQVNKEIKSTQQIKQSRSQNLLTGFGQRTGYIPGTQCAESDLIARIQITHSKCLSKTD
ncbi:hypothetical protein L484_012462 [Morus notabilis]|uniref:Uncharacterized protein n=1 Tax=Morus notabilis TaxID=981085 RepID=W9RP71_9ROSA|nr:hypothetical protein L484_012462 [Morus notabilis]